jgi:hypothetical protein
MTKEQKRLVGTVVPNVPTWAVYWDKDDDVVWVEPILFYSIWEHKLGDGVVSSISPVPFCSEYLDDEEENNEQFQGLSLTRDVVPEEWKRRS